VKKRVTEGYAWNQLTEGNRGSEAAAGERKVEMETHILGRNNINAVIFTQGLLIA
jgi:hypothetical protein